jgi:hypothetical protein
MTSLSQVVKKKIQILLTKLKKRAKLLNLRTSRRLLYQETLCSGGRKRNSLETPLKVLLLKLLFKVNTGLLEL